MKLIDSEQLLEDALLRPKCERIEFVESRCSNAEQRRELIELLNLEDSLPSDAFGGTSLDYTHWPPDAILGSVVGDYRIEQLLGHGGFGCVYRAMEQETGELVAIKFIAAGEHSDAALARFENERVALEQISHPHVAAYIAHGTMDGRPYVVMEFVDGPTITQYCHRKRLSLRSRLSLFLGVCDGMAEAHSQAILHRDVKPSNIIMETRHDKVVPKLIDFGTAKSLSDDLRWRSVATGQFDFIGTLGYASPEQVTARGVTAKSDVYSLGLVLYEILTGIIPFGPGTATSYDEVRHQALHVVPESPSTAIRHASDRPPFSIPRDLDYIVQKAIAKAPEHRYATVNALAEDVRRYLVGQPVHAHPPSKTYQTIRLLRQHWKLSVVVAMTICLLTASTAYSCFAWKRAQTAEQAAAARLVEATAATSRAVEAEATAEAINQFVVSDLIVPPSELTAEEMHLPHRERLLRTSGEISERFADRPLVEAGIRHALSFSLKSYDENGAALREIERVIELRSKRLPHDAPALLEARRWKAELLVNARCFDEGIEQLHELAETFRSIHGIDHATTIDCGILLGIAHMSNRNPKEAACILSRTAEIAEEAGFVAKAIEAQANLAQAYHRLRLWHQADILFRDVVDRSQHHHGPLAIQTLSYRLLQANHYIDWGMLRHVEAILPQLCHDLSQRLGTQHPGTVNAMRSLAAFYSEQDRYADAIDVTLSVLLVEQQLGGPNQPGTSQTLQRLACLYRDQQCFPTAEALAQFSMHQSHQVGDENPAKQATIRTIASIMRFQDRYVEELWWQCRLTMARFRTLGPEHESTISAWKQSWTAARRAVTRISLSDEGTAFGRPNHDNEKLPTGIPLAAMVDNKLQLTWQQYPTTLSLGTP